MNAVGEGALSNERSATPAAPATVPGAPTLELGRPPATGASRSRGARRPRTAARRSPATGSTAARRAAARRSLATLGNVTSWTDTGRHQRRRPTTTRSPPSTPSARARSRTSARRPGRRRRRARRRSSSATAGERRASRSPGARRPRTAARRSPATGSTAARRAAARRSLATLGNVTSWTDTRLANGTTYYYKVTRAQRRRRGRALERALRDAGAPRRCPARRRSTRPTAATAASRLGWTRAGLGRRLGGHRLPRSTAARRAAARRCSRRVGTATATPTPTVANGTTYYYKVSAVNARRRGRALERALRDAGAPATVPGAPTLDAATARQRQRDARAGARRPRTAARRSPATTSTAAPRAAARRCSRRSATSTSYTDTGRRQRHDLLLQSSPPSTPSARARLERALRDAGARRRPGAPTPRLGDAAGNSVTLALEAPALDGGSPITGYRVYRGTASGGETLLATSAAVTSYTDETTAERHDLLLQGQRRQRRRRGRALERALGDARAPDDTRAVEAAARLKALVVGTSQVALNWTASTDNVGVTGYRVYRDGALVATVADDVLPRLRPRRGLDATPTRCAQSTQRATRRPRRRSLRAKAAALVDRLDRHALRRRLQRRGQAARAARPSRSASPAARSRARRRAAAASGSSRACRPGTYALTVEPRRAAAADVHADGRPRAGRSLGITTCASSAGCPPCGRAFASSSAEIRRCKVYLNSPQKGHDNLVGKPDRIVALARKASSGRNT